MQIDFICEWCAWISATKRRLKLSTDLAKVSPEFVWNDDSDELTGDVFAQLRDLNFNELFLNSFRDTICESTSSKR